LGTTVSNTTPADLQLKVNVNSSVTDNSDLVLSIASINATSNSQTLTSPAAVNSVKFNIASAGSANVTANTSNTDQ